MLRIRGILLAIANGSKRLLVRAATPFSPATVAALFGFAATTMGLYMVYEPLALIIPGTGAIVFGLWLAGLGPRPPSNAGGDE